MNESSCSAFEVGVYCRGIKGSEMCAKCPAYKLNGKHPKFFTAREEQHDKFYSEQNKFLKSSEVKSDGGSSSYYQITALIDSDKIKPVDGHPEVSEVKLETGDIIRALVDNDFDLGNVIKACRRIHQAKQGKGKEGTSVEYDCKKIDYFLKQWYQAYCKEQM